MLQAPETFTMRTVDTSDRTPKFNLAKEIAKGFKRVDRYSLSEEVDFRSLLSGSNDSRRVLSENMQLGVCLWNETDKRTLERLYTNFNITYLEFTGTILVDSIGRRFHPCLSRLECGMWYWYVRNLAYVETANTIH